MKQAMQKQKKTIRQTIKHKSIHEHIPNAIKNKSYTNNNQKQL